MPFKHYAQACTASSALDAFYNTLGLMFVHITARDQLRVGQAMALQGDSPFGTYAAVFEDDGATGYFYALDSSTGKNPIVDAAHVYNGYDVADAHRPSEVKIGWSTNGRGAVLLINDYAHAVFDFVARQGYCRSGFPLVGIGSSWSAGGHAWDDEALLLFARDEP